MKKKGHFDDKQHKTAVNSEKSQVANPNVQSHVITSKKEFECYGCGKKGFIRSNCPDCKLRPSFPINQASVDIDVCDSSHLVEFSSINPELSRFQVRPIFSISICGANEPALIDTAAKLSVASGSLYLKF